MRWGEQKMKLGMCSFVDNAKHCLPYTNLPKEFATQNHKHSKKINYYYMLLYMSYKNTS